VLAHLLSTCSRIEIRLGEDLQLSDLLIERGDILFDDVGKLL